MHHSPDHGLELRDGRIHDRHHLAQHWLRTRVGPILASLVITNHARYSALQLSLAGVQHNMFKAITAPTFEMLLDQATPLLAHFPFIWQCF